LPSFCWMCRRRADFAQSIKLADQQPAQRGKRRKRSGGPGWRRLSGQGQ
jgi:hypothetical protein